MNNKNDSGKNKDLSDEYISRLMKTISGAVSDSGLETYRDDRREKYTYVRKERPEYFLRPEEKKISYEAEELIEGGVKDSIKKDPPRSYRISSRRTQDLSDINVYSLESMKLAPVPSGEIPGEEEVRVGEDIPEEALIPPVLTDTPIKEEEPSSAPAEEAREDTVPTEENGDSPGETPSEQGSGEEGSPEGVKEASGEEAGSSEEAPEEGTPEASGEDIPAGAPPEEGIESSGETASEETGEEDSEEDPARDVTEEEAEESAPESPQEAEEEILDEGPLGEDGAPAAEELPQEEHPEEDPWHETSLRAEFIPEFGESALKEPGTPPEAFEAAVPEEAGAAKETGAAAEAETAEETETTEEAGAAEETETTEEAGAAEETAEAQEAEAGQEVETAENTENIEVSGYPEEAADAEETAEADESEAAEEAAASEESEAAQAAGEDTAQTEENPDEDVLLDDDTVLGDEFFDDDEAEEDVSLSDTGEAEEPGSGIEAEESPDDAKRDMSAGEPEREEASGQDTASDGPEQEEAAEVDAPPADDAEPGEPSPEEDSQAEGTPAVPVTQTTADEVPEQEVIPEDGESGAPTEAEEKIPAPEEGTIAGGEGKFPDENDDTDTDREDTAENSQDNESIKEEENPDGLLPEEIPAPAGSGVREENGSTPERIHLASTAKRKNEKIRRAPVGHRSRAAGGYVPLLGIYLSLGILFMDMLMRCVLDIQKDPSRIMDVSTLYTMLFAFAFGFVADLIASVPKSQKGRRILSSILLAFPTALYLLEFFLKQTYGNYMGVRVIMGNATAVAGSYSGVIWQVIFRGIPMIILFCLPVILLNVLFRKLDRPSGKRAVLIKAVCALCAFALGIGAVMSSVSGAVTDREYFTSRFNIDKSITRFGLPMSLTLDCVYMIGGMPQAKEKTYPVYVPAMAVEGYVNMVDIDFSAITASHDYWPIPQMDEYFSSLAPTMKNEYTGMFEGKNLVFIVAEAFTGYVIDPVLTPTLYKMANEGFVFENYYQPSWFVSTSDGEYNLLTGLIPDFSIQSMLHTQDNNMYYTPGNVFRRLGYRTMAFHNHDYDYYDRDLTHEHLGYEFWMGMGNGMEDYVEEIWPESDEEMFRGTAHYLTECDGPFHVYYLTVSGHTEYNFSGNYMALKNRGYIDGTGLSEQVWAIKAQNLELERGLAYLMQELEAAGKLDDTVFVMSCDHYPYGMPDWAYNELAGRELDTVFERYRNTLFLYCSSMEEPVVVDKYCFGPDVIPTVYNLFGIEYDSRLFSGRDILSDADGLVIFNNYSWITAMGRYNANSGVFYPAEGTEIPDGYADTVSRVVADRIKFAKYILNYDYYDLVFGH